MFSTLGRHVQHCRAHYSVSPFENNCSVIEEDYARVLFILELITLKRDILNTRDKVFSLSDICAVISHECSFKHLLFF